MEQVCFYHLCMFIFRSTFAAGLKNLSAAFEQVASDRRACRMQLLKQLQPGLHVPNVAESVLQTSVYAVIFAAIVDRNTDTPAVQSHRRNRPTTTSKQASMFIFRAYSVK